MTWSLSFASVSQLLNFLASVLDNLTLPPFFTPIISPTTHSPTTRHRHGTQAASPVQAWQAFIMLEQRVLSRSHALRHLSKLEQQDLARPHLLELKRPSAPCNRVHHRVRHTGTTRRSLHVPCLRPDEEVLEADQAWPTTHPISPTPGSPGTLARQGRVAPLGGLDPGEMVANAQAKGQHTRNAA